MYFRFDRRHLEFIGDIGVCFHWQDLLEFTQQKPNIQRYFIQLYQVYQGCLLRSTILLVVDEFRQSKLLIMMSCLLKSRDAKVMKSMLSCREFICAKMLCHICLDKNVTQQRMLWGYIPPFATQGLNLSPTLLYSRPIPCWHHGRVMNQTKPIRSTFSEMKWYLHFVTDVTRINYVNTVKSCF